MARTRSTSKKRSAASSSRRKPPESLVFFIDRSLGRKKVPEALRAAGLDIRVHDELFPQATQDVVWLAFAQFDNDVRSDRTRAGMKAALELGRWVFLAPIGYLNAPRSIGKSLI